MVRVVFALSIAVVVVGALCVAAAVGGRVSASPSPLLVPRPQYEDPTDTTLVVSPSFAFQSVGFSSDVLTKATRRYFNITFSASRWNKGAVFTPLYSSTPLVMALNINVTSDNTTLALDTDESYVLNVTSPVSLLTAPTVFGALRGLETFSQLVQLTADGAYTVQQTGIVDFPRFHFRGYMIDSSRHYLPLTIIFAHLDAMAYSKMNVLHWHIVDDQSFPYVSTQFPNISAMGAYPNHLYQPEMIEQVVSYAYDRGIRVIAEFDTPGHTYSWGAGQPGFLTTCGDGSLGPVNPILPSTYTFLKSFFAEVATRFPDQYIHLGGDEVGFDCWQSNADIQQWMKEHNYTDYSLLEQYYEQNLLELVGGLGKDYIIWQDVFDNGVKVLPDTVVDVWKGGSDSWQAEVEAVTGAGLKTILSAPWYLNYISYGSDWPSYYSVDPGNFTGTPAQHQLMMGGEVCMWAEYVDATNALSRTWPRACAAAERFWSAADVTDQNDFGSRLQTHTCRLITRDIPAEPPNGPSYCDSEFKPVYNPPFDPAH